MTLEFSAESGREDGFGAEAALSSSGSGPGLGGRESQAEGFQSLIPQFLHPALCLLFTPVLGREGREQIRHKQRGGQSRSQGFWRPSKGKADVLGSQSSLTGKMQDKLSFREELSGWGDQEGAGVRCWVWLEYRRRGGRRQVDGRGRDSQILGSWVQAQAGPCWESPGC